MKQEKVLERVYEPRRLRLAWRQVKENAGAAGVDKVTVEQFEGEEEKNLNLIREKLQAGTYRFKPAKRVLIPKAEGGKKKRKLGIPTVMDRVVSGSINLVFEEIFDPDFTASNFGYRRGKSQKGAMRHVKEAVEDGYKWCVSVDLKSFFDEIPHGLILKLLRRKIRDEGLITLIARALKAGVIVDGVFEKTTKGSPQGSPLSPMISNIVLNEVDQELEKRGHRYCRWADDFLILLKTERASKRVMESITRYIEGELGLPVNKEKSEVAPIKGVEFLGYQILNGKIRIGTKARKKFKMEVRELTKRNNPLSMRWIIHELNEYLRGWADYYRIQEFGSIMGKFDRFVRNRLRSMQLKKWKKPRKFQRMMIRAGLNPKKAKEAWVRMSKWRSVKRKEVRIVLNLGWFRRQGLIFLDDFTERNLEFEFGG